MKAQPLSTVASAVLLAALPALLGACSDASAPQASPGSNATYYRDIKPIIESSCAGCHTAGGIAPFELSSFEDASTHKDMIRWAVTGKTMPPWMPADGCNDYLGDRSLTDEEIATIAGWVDAGAPEGDPAEAASGTADDSIKLSRVDLELPMLEAYTPQQSPDDYRCFILDWPEQELSYITGLGIKAGVPAQLHHMIAFLATPENVADFEKLDADEPGPGYTCYGGPGSTTGTRWVGAWVPGSVGNDMPPGTGIEVPPGSKIVLQLHYNTLYSKPAADLSTLLLRVDKTVEKKAAIMPFTDPAWVLNHQMPIPAHSADVTHSTLGDPTNMVSFLTGGAIASNVPLTIYGTGLHMHTRGKRATTKIQRADGTSECLLDIPRWNFHWQGSYEFMKTTTLSPGDKLSLECAWDNTTDSDINWGEGTTDEMCLSTYIITE